MPSWGEILKELKNEQPDAIRRKYLVSLNQLTKRNVIIYASNFQTPETLPGTTIEDSDIHGLMEAVKELEGDELDLILFSPGGSVTAAEAFVHYLRSRFSDIRVIIPQQAMSAATLIALSGDEIVMGAHSFLGPIDPQILITTSIGSRWVPAEAIIGQFKRIEEDLSHKQENFALWAQILPQYGPDLLEICENASKLSKELAEKWAEKFLLKNDNKRKEKAKEISEYLGNHGNFLSHGRNLPREEFEKLGIKITHLEDDQEFQDAVLSVFHAVALTFGNTACIKMIENHLGIGLFRMQQIIQPAPPNNLQNINPKSRQQGQRRNQRKKRRK